MTHSAPAGAELRVLLETVAADIDAMRVPQAAERMAGFLRADGDVLARAHPGQWSDLVRRAENHGVATEDLCRAHECAPPALRGPQSLHPSVAAAWRGFERRLAFRRALAPMTAARCRVIALGPACSAWALFNRWGFRDAPQSVRSFNPFCLAGHRPAAVAGMLRDGADAYAPLEQLRVQVWPKRTVIGRADGAALWSHHEGAHWTADDFRLFRANITDLMANLDAAFAEATPALKLFVFAHTTVDDTARLAAIYADLSDALARRCQGAWRLLGVNVPADPSLAPVARLERLTDAVSLVSMPMPGASALNDWWDAAIFNSDSGLAWEGALAALARDALAGWLAAAPGPAAEHAPRPPGASMPNDRPQASRQYGRRLRDRD